MCISVNLPWGLTSEERERVADDAVTRVANLRGDPWRLNKKMPPWDGPEQPPSPMQGKWMP